ncbi:MAG: RtcB family protein [Candidatus Pacearchaeota archaeon]|nr:RtcB family protein [Candidatus Pacearchaeota archaeon]
MEISKFKKISDYEWEIPKQGMMKVPGKIYASRKLIEEMDEKVWEQLSNVATLPGIQKASIAMADAHWGYGFPIGGVGVFDADEGGVVSVGGVGFDGGCGVRSLKTDLMLGDVKPKIKELIDELFAKVPAGLGCRGKILLSDKEVNEVLTYGAKWVVEKGYGSEKDLEFIEDNGTIKGANPEAVSEMAIKREKKQVGTLGSGNHYLEVQYIDEIYDESIAKKFGLELGQIMIWIHCGSRALGHQIGTDYLKVLAEASRKYKIPIHERELVCAPINSPEGQSYFGAMCCALNYAHANRQVIAHLVRQCFEKIFPKSNVETFYEISHNSCKAEKHNINGKNKVVYVHRKGATRAFGPEREELPKAYRNIGQPVLIGGTMGTFSYILHGTKEGEKSFFSACHGAGRAMSRTQAKKKWRGSTLIKELEAKGVYVKAHSMSGLAEEAPLAYKAVEDVVDAIHCADLARKVARLKPIGNIKG